MTATRVGDGPPPRSWFGREFVIGASYLAKGMGMWVRAPRLMAVGILPALISFVLLAGAVVALAFYANDLAGLVTPFADDWAGWLRASVRAVATAAVFGLGLLLAVVLYTGVTLAIGEPFYEKISRGVEERLGGVPDEANVPWTRSLPRSIVDSIRLVATSAVFGIAVFAFGLIPILGQVGGPVIGALGGGWFLACELVGVPFERRGLRLRDRRRSLRQRRPMAVGFGVATFVCFLIPFGAIVMMPAAVAGATMMSRRLFGLSHTLPARPGG
jgi:CysZ protein